LQKAKASRLLIERLITLAKENSLSAKRDAFQILRDHRLVSILCNEIGPRFANRQSGFTRIMNLRRRRGDNANMVILELTEIKEKAKKKEKKEKEIKPQKDKEEETGKEKAAEEKKASPSVAVKEKPPISKKPTKKILGGLRKIFKKERDSL